MRGVPCAPLLLLVCLLLPLLLLLLYLCNRFVDSSPYLAFHPCPAEAALIYLPRPRFLPASSTPSVLACRSMYCFCAR